MAGETNEKEAEESTGHARLLKKYPILGWIGLFLFVGTTGAHTTAPTVLPNPFLNLSFQNQRLSAEIDRISLQTVLSALSAQLPVQFIVKGINQDNLVSTSFTNLPFDQGLERLLVGYDYAIVHFPIGRFPSAVPSGQQIEVIVLSRNQNSSTLASWGTAEILSPPALSQSPAASNHQEPTSEDHTLNPETPNYADEQNVTPLLKQALENSDPEIPQLIQDLLTKSGSFHE
ncbi:MAG: small multi-drug export protein [Nitrospirales bacterium]|nr:small multi-drug export protein [Nitrospirales bacterium]